MSNTESTTTNKRREQMKRVRRSSNPPTRPDDKRLHPKPGDGRGNPRKPVELKRRGFQVSFAPAIVEQIDQAARREGLSRSAWLEMVAVKYLEMEASLRDAMGQGEKQS